MSASKAKRMNEQALLSGPALVRGRQEILEGWRQQRGAMM
jgi:hypothetical protein